MAQIHILLVLDSESGEIRTAPMQEAPVDSDEIVFDDPEWRPLTEPELAALMAAEDAVAKAVEPLRFPVT